MVTMPVRGRTSGGAGPVAATMPRRPAVVAVVVLLSVVAMALVPPSARAADPGAEGAFVAAVNGARASAGLPPLEVAGDLVAVARRHAVRMADAADLHHNPGLAGEVAGWQKVGENVGRGPAVDVVHEAFMASPGHRANVLEAAWTQVGVGVEVRDGRVWVTEVFRQPAVPAPPPAPTPEPVAPEPAGPEPAGPEPSSPEPPSPEPVAPEPATTGASEAGPPRPASSAPAAAEPAPTAPSAAREGDRALVMLTRVAADDVALDAA